VLWVLEIDINTEEELVNLDVVGDADELDGVNEEHQVDDESVGAHVAPADAYVDGEVVGSVEGGDDTEVAFDVQGDEHSAKEVVDQHGACRGEMD